MSDDIIAEYNYELGHKQALRGVLGTLIKELGSDDPDANAERWRLERMDTIAALRSICEDHGDNDWEDNLHLADVVNKHLSRHLYE